MNYPYYDSLVERLSLKVDKSIDISSVCATINNIAYSLPPAEVNEHYREIGALILHHENIENGGFSLSPLPYEGQQMGGGRGVLYRMTRLPPRLQQILAQYIEDNI